MDLKQHNNLRKTFARRISRKLSDAKQHLLDNVLPSYRYEPHKFSERKNISTILEIGFGMGEHFNNLLDCYPNYSLIGAEVYLNGVINVLKNLTKEHQNRVFIWPDDVDLLLQQIPNDSLSKIFILFPDPWPKRRYLAKRLFNQNRLEIFKTKLHHEGEIIFGSDIEDYFTQAHKLVAADDDMQILNTNFSLAPEFYSPTKYHRKALAEGRTAQFLQASFIKATEE